MTNALTSAIEKALQWEGPHRLGQQFTRGPLPDPGLCSRILTPIRLLEIIQRRSLAQRHQQRFLDTVQHVLVRHGTHINQARHAMQSAGSRSASVRRLPLPAPRMAMLMIVTTTHTEPEVNWVSINLKAGGIDYTPANPTLRRLGGASLKRLDRLGDLATFTGQVPDVIFFQEGRTYDVNGAELLHYAERVLRRTVGPYRGLLTRSDHNDLHRVVFIHTGRVEVVRHWRGEDPNEGTRRYGWVEVIVDGDETRTLWLKSEHLDPRDGDARLRHVRFTTGALRGNQRAIYAGDFNSSISRRTRHQGEPQRHFLAQDPFARFGKGYWPPKPRWWWSPRRRRNHDTIADTRALDYLIDIGWRDQHTADHNATPTINTGVDRGGELIIDRCFTRGPLRTVPGSVRVDTKHPDLSDHRAVRGTLIMEPHEEKP